VISVAMSLKITVEVDGQSEQQLAPLLAQVVTCHPEWFGMDRPAKPPEPSSRDFYHDNSVLLLQLVQQLTAQNELLQAQVTHSQRLLAGVPPAKALSPAATDSQRAGTASAVAAATASNEAPPLLPVQYQLNRGEFSLYRFKRLAEQLPARLWQTLIWLTLGREWLLLFLLMCGGMYGVLSIAPKLADLWPAPEFVDSAGSAPGDAVAPERREKKEASKESASSAPQPALPSSKAGTHPPPPPAFRQQP
jgi:hypothetical protein